MSDEIYDLTVWKDNSTVFNNFRNYLSFINDCHTIRYTIDSGKTVQLYTISRYRRACRSFETFTKSINILKHFINNTMPYNEFYGKCVRTLVLKKNEEENKQCEQILEEIVDTVEKIAEQSPKHIHLSEYENEYIYVVSVNSCDGDLSKSRCTICQTADDAIATAFSYATTQDDNSEFDDTGCYSLSTYSITTHCLGKGAYGHMNSLYKPTHESEHDEPGPDEKSHLSPIVTGNVHIDYDVELSDIFTDKISLSPTKPYVEEDNKIGNIDLHQMGHSRVNTHDIRRRQWELTRFGRGRGRGHGHSFWLRKQEAELECFQERKIMGMDSEMDSRNDELERERMFNSRYHHDYNLRHRRHNQFNENSYPRRGNFRNYEHIPFAKAVHVDTDTGTVTSVKRDFKKNNYDDYDTNFWSTDESEDEDEDIEECQDEPDELDGTAPPVSEDVSDSGIKITVIEDSDDENLSDTRSKHEQDLASIENAFAEMEKMDKDNGEKIL